MTPHPSGKRRGAHISPTGLGINGKTLVPSYVNVVIIMVWQACRQGRL